MAAVGLTVATFDGVWHLHSGGASAPSRPGVLVDAPTLHGVLLVSGGADNTWLWDGAHWSALGSGGFGSCFAPSSGAWNPVDGQLVFVMSSQCSNSHEGLPSETWVFDGKV